MGTGQTPPQNVICLLLGWTVLANKAEPIPSLLQHTHTHVYTPSFSWVKYNWGQARGDQSRRLVYEGGRYFCVKEKQIPVSLCSTLLIYSPKKEPLGEPSPPQHTHTLPFIGPPQSGLNQNPSAFPLGCCDPLHVPAMDKSRLTSSQMLGQFSNTRGPTQIHRFVLQSKASSPTQTHKTLAISIHITNVSYCSISKSVCIPTDSQLIIRQAHSHMASTCVHYFIDATCVLQCFFPLFFICI